MKKNRKRKNHNGILIELEALLNLDIGLIYCIADKDASLIKEQYLNATSDQLEEMKCKDQDFLYNAFNGNLSKDIIDEIALEYKKNSQDDLITKSPEVQSIKRIIEIFAKSAKDLGSPVLVQRDFEILPQMKKRFPTLPILEHRGNENFDFVPYARFIIEDIERLYEYGKIDFTHITVLNYEKNFTVVEGKRILHPAPVLLYGITNRFDIIDPITRR